MKICILTQSALAANPRVRKEAQALTDAGHEVIVVCGRYKSWSSSFEAAAAPAGVTVRHVPYGPAAPPFKRVVQVVRRKAAEEVLRRINACSFLASYAVSDVTPALTKAAINITADLYIAHYVAALPAAAAGARANNAHYAFDAEDYHPGDALDIPENALENRIINLIEGRHLPGCSYMTAASPGIANAYSRQYRVPRPGVVLNVFPKCQAPAKPTSAGWFKPGPSLYWFSQTIGPDRGLECAVDAIGLSRAKPHLVLRGNAIPSYLAQLRKRAELMGVSDRLHVLAPAAPDEMARLAAPYDLAFVGETGETENHQIMLSNKQFTYLLAGVPALLTDIPAHVDFARVADGAVEIYERENATSLARALDSFLLDPVLLANSRHRAFQLGQTKFNWDIEQQRLVQMVDGALGNGQTMGQVCSA